MTYFLSYYLASIIMAIYLSKEKGLKFEATLNGKKFNKGLTLFLTSPLILPLILLKWNNDRK